MFEVSKLLSIQWAVDESFCYAPFAHDHDVFLQFKK